MRSDYFRVGCDWVPWYRNLKWASSAYPWWYMGTEHWRDDHCLGKTEVLTEEPAPRPLCPPRVPYEEPWDWTRASVVRSRWLRVRDAARDSSRLIIRCKNVDVDGRTACRAVQRPSCSVQSPRKIPEQWVSPFWYSGARRILFLFCVALEIASGNKTRSKSTHFFNVICCVKICYYLETERKLSSVTNIKFRKRFNCVYCVLRALSCLCYILQGYIWQLWR